MNLRKITLCSLISLPLLGLATYGCSNSPSTENGGPEGQGGEGPGGKNSLEGEGGAPAVVEVCDPKNVDVPDASFFDANCDGIDGDPKNAIFVSPLGDDEGAGTMEAPLATLAQAVQLAVESGKDVYACSGTYEENLELTSSVRLFGGFACEEGWTRTKRRAEVVPLDGLPLSIVDVSNAAPTMLIDSFLFDAGDAKGAGESSIAGKIIRSTNVELIRTEFRAGKGADAGEAQAAEEFSEPALDGKTGWGAPSWNSMFSSGCYVDDFPLKVWIESCKTTAQKRPEAWRCTGDCSSSCELDDGKTVDVSRSYGGDGSSGYAEPVKNAGQGLKNTGAPLAGQAGSNGAAADAGFGLFNEEGEYLPTNTGALGKYGRPGVSGRGGDGAPATYLRSGQPFNQVGGAGGSSGMPGCGGRPGQAGLAGGASIGLVVIYSEVTMERVSIVTDAGGVGGSGSRGGAGQKGGAGGSGGQSRFDRVEGGTHQPDTTFGGKSGEAGGDGASGGDGGAGAGGPSVGVAVVGEKPELKAMTFDIGLGGDGGAPLEGSDAAKGADGASTDVYSAEVAK